MRRGLSSRAKRGICLLLGMTAAVAACSDGGAREIPGLRLATKSYRFTITPTPIPPFANETTFYTVKVIDRSTDQPVQNGEGQIYGQLAPVGGPRTWDSFVYGPEVGTYHAYLRFAINSISGSPDEAWQMGLRFRRDSLSPIEVVNWSQQVRPERGFGPVRDSIRR
jgi:hypothetical protein